MPYNIYGAAIENNIGALSTPKPRPLIQVWENEKKKENVLNIFSRQIVTVLCLE